MKYDEQGNVLFEVLCSKEKDSNFYSVSFHEENYVVVGSYVSDKNTKIAYIVSYDSTGKMIWEKDYSILTDTEFYKVIALNDGYVVVGESNGETDEKDVGGAIIVKFDFDGNVVWSFAIWCGKVIMEKIKKQNFLVWPFIKMLFMQLVEVKKILEF